MDEKEKRTQRDYTLAFKLAVVDEVEKGELTYTRAQARYGIQGPFLCAGLVTQAWSPRLG